MTRGKAILIGLTVSFVVALSGVVVVAGLLFIGTRRTALAHAQQAQREAQVAILNATVQEYLAYTGVQNLSIQNLRKKHGQAVSQSCDDMEVLLLSCPQTHTARSYSTARWVVSPRCKTPMATASWSTSVRMGTRLRCLRLMGSILSRSQRHSRVPPSFKYIGS